MSATLEELISLLDLKEVGGDRFLGTSPGARRAPEGLEAPESHAGFLFGGQVLAQALMAASRTVEVDRRLAHSLHAYFLRAGDSRVPLALHVERTRDGRSFSTRRVVVSQKDLAIFTLTASFHVEEQGFVHQLDERVDAPDPETLPTFAECLAEVSGDHPEWIEAWMTGERAIEQRPVDGFPWSPEKREPVQRVWLRASGPLPEAPCVHQAAFAYASDMSLIDTATFPHAVTDHANLQVASLDHALWFHAPFRMEDWLLYVQDSPVARGARGFARGKLFDRAGALVASVAQEGLIRPPASRSAQAE